jgi:ribosomal-protein-alanine N-acetyltransferase
MSAVVREPAPAVRDMRPADLPEIAAVERSAYDYPWSPGIFRDCLLAGYTCLVAEADDRLLGYAILSVAAGEAHLLNICIRPDAQGQGLGRRLLGVVVRRAAEAGAERVFLEVRPSNRVAMRLYVSEGFRRVGMRPRYYQSRDGREDAVVLCRSLAAAP